MSHTKNVYNLSLKTYKDVYDSLYVSLCLFARNYVHDLDLAKDLVQEVFIKVWEDKVGFRNEATVKSYMYMAVKNKCFDLLKSKRFRSTENMSVEDMDELTRDSFYLKEVVIEEVSTRIETAIDTLPKKCAQIIRLSIGGLTNPEIAQHLGISLNTVKAQKKIAYKKLRPLLKDYFVLMAFVFDYTA
ncbi:RNA polymerase sigma-70 factor [Pseudozobellia thermophila]|uniref:RNA polymerase sigma-70 factor, ECF subfamily n=1 Tax=Pseudozobellia thermophila TaxID=192903 RepID=A0A1M6EM99_9FLAO|nr:RNA polymerase sigma-70 factor [Pseudozobellia thermophila]SHI86637.1 RNA polymerase sigma-70 factor, ECF subfamily [Pseudozobellia thermophila]